LVLAFLAVLTACTVAQMEKPQTEDEAFPKPKPEFPMSEYTEAQEGWVLIDVMVQGSGLIDDLNVRDSSGSAAFEQAALEAVEGWRFTPGDEREESVLLSFVYDRKEVGLSRRFINLNNQAHELIGEGDLGGADELLTEMRSDPDLSAFELAYSYLTAGRLAGARGDQAAQLHYFRKAMLNEGRWLARENYLPTLRATVILAIDKRDYASAVRDYELLIETRAGRKQSSDLEEPIEAIRAHFDGGQFDTQPYMAADNSVSVEREWPQYSRTNYDPRAAQSSMGNWTQPSAPAKKGK
jgi:TonB family protein